MYNMDKDLDSMDFNSSVDEFEFNFNNRFIIHPNFNKTIKELNELKIKLPEYGSKEDWDFSMIPFPKEGNYVSNIDEIKPYKLNAKNGYKNTNSEYPLLAYDESIQNYLALEGTSYFFSHSMIIHGKVDYIPSIFISFYFFTRAKSIIEKSKYIIESDNPSVDSKAMYAKERTDFILNTSPENSIVLIDGPLIGGQISSITVDLNRKLLKKNVIPLFIVKNSTSNLVTQYTAELKGKYNSDMHWCYNTLKSGERTNYFSYYDRYNVNNGKIFCYVKPFNISPQRIEVHIETFKKYQGFMNDLMDMVYYLILAQGDYKNPQARSIAIAEKFARESLKLFNLRLLMKQIGLIATINESRFGGN